MSEVIKITGGRPAILQADAWALVRLAPAPAPEPGAKVLPFKRTGQVVPTPEQIAATYIPPGPVLVPLSLWLARRSELAERLAQDEVGVWLETHELSETLADSVADEPLGLDVFPVIAVHVERFVDGRACSHAMRLRGRYRYTGELRAFGDVLRDQLYFLRRCGFCTFSLRAGRSAAEAVAALSDFSEPYQAAAVVDQPLWRRHARA